MGVLKLDDLDPDGVPIFVEWDRMRLGDSLFIPCLNTTAAMKQVRAVFARRRWNMRVQIRTENHIWGLRIWRIA